MKPVLVASIPIGDPDDPVIYAGFAIAAWEKTPEAARLKEYRMSPTMWKLGMTVQCQTVDLWCEKYTAEDLALARLSGVLDR